MGDDVPLNTLIPDTLATPQTPGPEAVKQHVLTHLPYQSWCRFCVEGRGRDDRHRRQTTLSEQQLTTPRIEVDFKVLDDIGPALSRVDSSTSFGTCVYLPQGKQSRDPYAARRFGSFLRMHPAPALILQVDSEPSLVAMARLACASVTTKQVELRTSVRASKGSLGLAERYHSTVAGLARSLLARVRATFVVGSEANELLGPWALRHASWLSNRFQPHRPSGRSSFELLWAHAWKGFLLPFGEVCLVRRDVDRLPSKFDARWQRGLYLGHDDNSNAHVVLTCYGVQLSRSIRRLPAEYQRDKVVFEEANGHPWDMLADGRVEAHMKRKERETQAGEQEGRLDGEPAREPGGGEGSGQASVPELIPMVLPESVAASDPPAAPTPWPAEANPTQRADASMPGTPLGSSMASSGSSDGSGSSSTPSGGPAKKVRFAADPPGAGIGPAAASGGQGSAEGVGPPGGQAGEAVGLNRPSGGELPSGAAEAVVPEPKRTRVQGLFVAGLETKKGKTVSLVVETSEGHQEHIPVPEENEERSRVCKSSRHGAGGGSRASGSTFF
jgi:hypothetical protein